MRLFNAKTNQVESFQPDHYEITMYTCVKSVEHLSLDAAFTFCIADMLAGYLAQIKGYRIRHHLINIENNNGNDGSTLLTPLTDSVKGGLKTLNLKSPAFIKQEDDVIFHNPQTDLLLLHPDCEIADIQAITKQRPFAQFWLQLAPVIRLQPQTGEKSNKQIQLQEFLKYSSPNALRIYFAQQHYRRAWRFDEVALRRAGQYSGKLNAAMQAVSSGDLPINLAPVHRRFAKALEEDFNTLKGVASLLNLADEILFRARNGYFIDEAQIKLQHLASILGLNVKQPSRRRRLYPRQKHSKIRRSLIYQ